jgi:hypothetical protein
MLTACQQDQDEILILLASSVFTESKAQLHHFTLPQYCHK